MIRNIIHKDLAEGGWQKLSLMEQMGNIGSEVGRAAKWREKADSTSSPQADSTHSTNSGQDEENFRGAVERALELFDLTLEDPRWRGRRGEIARAREVFCDAALGRNEYKTSLKDLDNYFLPFAYAARNDLGKATIGSLIK